MKFKCCMTCNCNLRKIKVYNNLVELKCLINNDYFVKYKDYFRETNCKNYVPARISLKK